MLDFRVLDHTKKDGSTNHWIMMLNVLITFSFYLGLGVLLKIIIDLFG
jgi:hypothetical protein